jgi:hypothetical protein
MLGSDRKAKSIPTSHPTAPRHTLRIDHLSNRVVRTSHPERLPLYCHATPPLALAAPLDTFTPWTPRAIRATSCASSEVLMPAFIHSRGRSSSRLAAARARSLRGSTGRSDPRRQSQGARQPRPARNRREGRVRRHRRRHLRYPAAAGDLALLLRAMQRLSRESIPVVIVRGNHDHPGRAPKHLSLPPGVTVLPDERAVLVEYPGATDPERPRPTGVRQRRRAASPCPDAADTSDEPPGIASQRAVPTGRRTHERR